ncbi:membrane protein, partial [Streptomyces sp. RSD-27]
MALAADAVALVIIVWIVMDLLGANRSNEVVQWF